MLRWVLSRRTGLLTPSFDRGGSQSKLFQNSARPICARTKAGVFQRVEGGSKQRQKREGKEQEREGQKEGEAEKQAGRDRVKEREGGVFLSLDASNTSSSNSSSDPDER